MPSSIQESKLAGQNLDALVVGVGFSLAGVYTLYNLRKLGYNVKAFEAGGTHGTGTVILAFGSVQTFPFISSPWKTCGRIGITQSFPQGAEIQDYFHYVKP
jgi:cation diffusion facilitator CzcD-associated flavoprotein CzcO